MPDVSLSQFIGLLALAANVGIGVMIILLLGERSHIAWTQVRVRAEEMAALRESLERQAEEAEQAIQTMRSEIDDLQNQVKRAEGDIEALQQRHKETDLPFGYTAMPVDFVDRRYRTWRVIVRNPDLGADAGSLIHPAQRWIEGRLYELPAPNIDYAIAVMQERFPLREGFTVEPARERSDEAAEAAG
jgi:hypothetical protein